MEASSDPVLEAIVSNAFQRFHANLSAALPRSAPKLRELLRRVPTRPEHALNPSLFPHLVLPYWLSPSSKKAGDAEFQTDVIYSSINGYYSIRLCDNIVDNDSPADLRKLAPCALYFDNEAIRTYAKHFPAAHAFWTSFDEYLAQQAEMSAADALLENVDAEIFASLSSRKFTGAKIPLAAVRFRYPERAGAYANWMALVDALGAFAQFSNDFFDWRHDAEHAIVTYVSSEFRRRAQGENFAIWFLRDGFDWGASELKTRFDNVKLLAETLGNDALSAWLAVRGRKLEDDVAKLGLALQALTTLEKTFSDLLFQRRRS